MDGTVWALVTTCAVAIFWIAVTPKEVRGRIWHVALAPVVPAVLAVRLAVPPGLLEDALSAWLVAGIAGAAVLLVAWIVGTAMRNHGMMDVAYNLAPVAIAWTAAARTGHPLSPIAFTALATVSLWAVRLGIQTLRDNLRREREPYATWRARNGRRWIWWSLFQVYALQGVTLWIWSLPLVLAASAPMNVAALTAGLIAWILGFALQAVADQQLETFRDDPANRGRILSHGAWALVRQPNYLGESAMWWGYGLLALAHPIGALGLFGPIYQTWFMGFGSAGPQKEAHMRRTRAAAWQAYCERTPRFFPLPRPSGGGAADTSR